MSDNSLSSIAVCKERLQEHLLTKVRQRLSGRDDSDIVRSPSRSLFAGVLKPQYEKSGPDDKLDERQQASSLGIDCRIRPKGNSTSVELHIRASWALYYAVYPSWTITLRENAVLKQAGTKGSHSEILLPVTFRRKVVMGKPITINLDDGVVTDKVFDLTGEIETAKVEIDRDEDRWHHLGSPKDQVRSLGVGVDIGSELDYIKKLKGFVRPDNFQKLPDWKVTLHCNIEKDALNDGCFRVKALLSNETPAFDETVADPHLVERCVFDASVEMSHENGEVVPFEFHLAARDYRNKPNMIARGINCVVQSVPSGASLITETIPVFEQPYFRTRPDSGMPFDSLDSENVEDVLGKISASMNSYLSEWDGYLHGQANNVLSESELGQCKRDRDNFASERAAFKLGIECLKQNDDLRESFRLMNRAFGRLGVKSGGKISAWRLFQICFVVSQLPALLVRELNDNYKTELREAVTESFAKVSVLWFPTGGGKTEAYLGLIATALLFDRLRGKSRGLNTWMRFPLRMLSLQQMERLAKVIAELNVLREEESQVGQGDPFSVGFYVGRTVSPNAMSDSDMTHYEKRPENRRELLILRKCPYCSSSVDIEIDRKHWRVLHKCTSDECFSNQSSSLGDMKGALPIFVVDNEIYRYLPSVLVGTVDKLAIAGFNKGFSHLLRGAVQRCPEHGYTSYNECLESYNANCKRKGKRKLENLDPVRDPGPSLLLQDELHLLRADLGVFNGHYEGLLQYIGSKTFLPPKVLAATATIEAYDNHAFHLYLKQSNRFPEPSWMNGESFYATSSPYTVRRRYVGVLCHTKAIHDAASQVLSLYQYEIKFLKSNLAVAREVLDANDLSTDEVADVLRLYDLSLAYVNRKTTGSTLLNRLGFANARLTYDGLQEISTDLLTGDRTQDDIGSVLERIEQERDDTGSNRLDVVAATSLISHGIDIERINMMTICGMPSHYAEYVQSTSRSARSHPGLVFSCFLSKDVRELSQFEMFFPMHENISALIEPVAVNRFASFAPSKTVPGLVSALLINHLGPLLFNGSVAKPLVHVPTVKVAFGMSSTGSSGTVKCIEIDELLAAVEEIIGVNGTWSQVSQKEVENVRKRIEEVFEDVIAKIGRSPERWLPEVLHPITSFRDVDEGLEFGSLDSSSLVTKLSGR